MESATQSNYRTQLMSELARRRRTNPLYSLRAFAKAIDVSPAHLSKVLRGEKSLSLETAQKITQRLQYSANEALQFCQMVQESRLPSPDLKQALKLVGQENDGPITPLSLESFQVISDWYHFALRELTECRDFQPTPEYVARRLGISRAEAKLAIDRLLRLGLLEKKGGRLKKTSASVITSVSADRSRVALKAFHSQMIEKARQSIESQASEEREITGLTLPISRDKIEIARAEIAKFRNRMLRLLESSRATDVYQLNIQFFALTENPGGKATK